MLPHDTEIKIPEYLIDGKSSDDIRTHKLVAKYLKIVADEEMKKKAVSKEKKFVKMGMVMIRMLQSHEKARQARAQFSEEQKRYVTKQLIKQRENRKGEVLNLSRKDATVIIQRAWKSYLFRKRLNDGYISEMKFLNMLPRKEKDKMAVEVENDRRNIIKRNEDEYLRAKEALKEEMMTYRVSQMMEDLEDKIRYYFHKYKEIYGNFPVFPTEEEGGSTKMFEDSVDDVIDDEEKTSEMEDAKETKSEKSSKSSKSKDDKAMKEAKGKEEKGKEQMEEEEQAGFKLKTSKYIPDLIQLNEEYQKVWAHYEPVNFDKYDPKIVEEEVMKDVVLIVRLQVDEKMRMELLQLTEALQKDTKKKAKGAKKQKQKGKKEKGKKEKDLTPERTLESLIEELIIEGIIVDYPKCTLSEFVGDYNISGSLQQSSTTPDMDPFPCLGDIRKTVIEYCILPMGSEDIHSKGAFVKSVLFAGPHGVGKKSLVYAIANEIGAVMMNLSAENIQGKYPGKEGLQMLLHLVSKVGRLVQPTVIYIKDAENYFWKKKPPTTTLSESGRLKKELPKFVKKIGASDRILVCGTTVLPFDVDLKGMGASYEKIICILKPDYKCRRCLWREMILKHHGSITPKLNISVLSNISDGFTAGDIKKTVQSVLTRRRLAFQKKIPLSTLDFISCLAECVPVYEEEVLAYKLWYKKMPIAQFEPCDRMCCPAGKFHFQLKRQSLCKGSTDLQLCSDSPQISWSLLPQLRALQPPMRTSPSKHNAANTSLCMTCSTGGANVCLEDGVSSHDHRRDECEIVIHPARQLSSTYPSSSLDIPGSTIRVVDNDDWSTEARE
ncbi:IQ and AAA domain-containing protein 1, partial [Stegodyphus mimosarum]